MDAKKLSRLRGKKSHGQYPGGGLGLFFLVLAALMVMALACSCRKEPDDLVEVCGPKFEEWTRDLVVQFRKAMPAACKGGVKEACGKDVECLLRGYTACNSWEDKR